MASKVEVAIDADVEQNWSRNISPTRLVVETDGQTLTSQVEAPKNSVGYPMTERDFDEKMQECLEVSGQVWPADTAVALREVVHELVRAEDVTDLVRRLTQSTRSS